MIDYYKLKEAHELIELLNYGLLTVRHSKHDGTNYYFEYMSDDIITRKGQYFECIDALIINLKKLTHPEPKYRAGDNVWFHSGMGDIDFFTIQNLDIKELEDGSYSYNDHCEIDLYPSREALIKSQIEYWTSLKNG